MRYQLNLILSQNNKWKTRNSEGKAAYQLNQDEILKLKRKYRINVSTIR